MGKIDANGTTEIPNLALLLLEQSMTETQHIVQRVENNYRLQIARLHGEIDAIQDRVDVLISGAFLPHPHTIHMAVMLPEPALVDRYARQYAEQMGWDPETGELGNTTGT